MTTLIRPLTEDEQSSRDWIVEVDGKTLHGVHHIRFFNPNIGEINYGMTPGGYDGLSIHENYGGGVAMVPFCVIDGEMYVGMLSQYRHNQGGLVWNLPRGFMDPGERHFQAMVREFEEEVEYSSPDKLVKPLTENHCNPNSTFFETAGEGEGVKFFSIEILPEFLEKRGEIEEFVFRSDLLKPLTSDAEKIFGSVFFPWRVAIYSTDLFTVGGVGRLMAAELVRV